ncbi:helix-turn-helix transcriptional regulator [Photobacterium sp. SDRW27]|uniref:helix-turn-helix transcriptional regulator n=1 Tax=Photobacterium obscurum TaxID=2829490 RepID=UPI0022430479|nr:helix-turn-helix transcriptional regulator [Photobacterium obscurum]MCW8329899.1 helix-turn-helix transcriptional regulator [Photobacterium obscurum]
MERVQYWVKELLEAGQSTDDLNRVVQDIGRYVGADLSLFFLGAPPKRGKQWVLHHGIDDNDFEFYLRHADDDVYLQHYLSHSLTGKMVSLQEMLPLKRIDDSWFVEEMIPRLAIRHSISGLCPIAPDQALAITFHRYCQPFSPKSKEVMQKLLQAMIPWSQFFIARNTLESIYGSPSIAKGIMKLPGSLTQAEHNIVALLAQGYDGSEITAIRGVSKETTKSQIKSILHKTGCRHQNQLLQQIFCGA